MYIVRNKSGPYILLFILAVILVFIIGVRYGQRVEKANKVVSSLLTITPTRKPTEPPLEFKTFENKTCGITFLYPSALSVQKEGSVSAVLGKNKKHTIAFSCEKANPFGTTSDVATESGQIILKKFNPQNGRTVYFLLSEELSPLLETSLKFSPK